MKKIISLLLCALLTFAMIMNPFSAFATKNEAEITNKTENKFEINAKSAVLMEAETGEILLEKDLNEKAPLASVTKIMTLLLVMEAVNDSRISLNDKITISDYAASMGGSQVFLEEGVYCLKLGLA